ncbi:protein NRT1/ PTR FAMILY 7.3 isoform X1 [Dendrobium catenatum]|uniref:Nitrate transporter 1.5 n=1 Tax=Dendrobium catenatum TaxID=906689 RepID=A0A2I0WC45_9ASPA|nr:protein NRT1/ PTR FAMILY 7.3 isoform X1 [Dendrobium catenatum]PKU73223.1 Nitrate transporter 1.5 [Dendrobium catenatum]
MMINSKNSKTKMEQLEQGRRGREGEVELGRDFKEKLAEYTTDGSVDISGQVAAKASTGGWVAAGLVLVNQGLATLAFFGVGVNLVLFLTRVVGQNNADAANNVSKWTGTVYIFSLVGAFLSDSYWGRYKTCVVFQLIFVIGLITLSLSSQMFMLRPSGCGNAKEPCGAHSSLEMGLFYLSIYLVALGNGGYQPNIATFGSDQFEEGDPREAHSKVSFFSYFYLALNLGSLFSNTFLSYYQDEGLWALGFWASSGSALLALILFLCGTRHYRHFRPGGNPLSRVSQVVLAALKKWKVKMPPPGEEDLYELDGKEIEAATTEGSKRILHSEGFRFLDRAALITTTDFTPSGDSTTPNPWRLCTITQVEEVKCILRLLPIWLCTILYSVVFTQMASLFVEQGAAMNTTIVAGFRIPPASMSAFDILSVALFIFFYRRLLQPIAAALRHDPRGLTELHRMGVGLIVAVAAMIAAGFVEHFRLKLARGGNASSLSILWQVPQYMLIGASEVFMYVGQLEFFNEQAPEGLKSFGSALCMTSISLGNYVSDILVTVVMKITGKDDSPGWIPVNLNRGHMDRFYFLLATLTSVDFVIYVICAKWYKCIKIEGKCEEEEEEEEDFSD